MLMYSEKNIEKWVFIVVVNDNLAYTQFSTMQFIINGLEQKLECSYHIQIIKMYSITYNYYNLFENVYIHEI